MEMFNKEPTKEAGYLLVIGDRGHKLYQPLDTFSNRIFTVHTNVPGLGNKLKAAFGLIKTLTIYPNLVIIVDTPGYFGLFACIVSRILKKKFVLRIRGDIWKSIPQWNSGLKLILRRLIADFLFLHSDLILPVSQHLAWDIRNRFPQVSKKVVPILVPFNDVSTDFRNQLPEEIQRLLRKQIEKRVLVTVTNFDFIGKVQGLRDFIPIFRELVKRRKGKVVWLIAGKGRNLLEFEIEISSDPEIADYIQFLGFVRPVSAFLEFADLFVYFTYEDGFPNVVVEAQLSGKTVLVNRFGPLVEQVDDGKTGYFLDPSEIELCLDLILKLLEDKELRVRIGQQAREDALTRYSNQIIGKAYQQTLSRLNGLEF